MKDRVKIPIRYPPLLICGPDPQFSISRTDKPSENECLGLYPQRDIVPHQIACAFPGAEWWLGAIMASESQKKNEQEEELRGELLQLRQEHRDLDAAIAAMVETGDIDTIRIQRLKKRKLVLKDRIAAVQTQLLPDIIA
jgi:hypothetical protein